MKKQLIFDPVNFWKDKTTLELAALAHLLPRPEKTEILNIVRAKALKLTREWATDKSSRK